MASSALIRINRRIRPLQRPARASGHRTGRLAAWTSSRSPGSADALEVSPQPPAPGPALRVIDLPAAPVRSSHQYRLTSPLRRQLQRSGSRQPRELPRLMGPVDRARSRRCRRHPRAEVGPRGRWCSRCRCGLGQVLPDGLRGLAEEIRDLPGPQPVDNRARPRHAGPVTASGASARPSAGPPRRSGRGAPFAHGISASNHPGAFDRPFVKVPAETPGRSVERIRMLGATRAQIRHFGARDTRPNLPGINP